MSIRKRNDSVKSGKGIDGDLGEDFVKPGPDMQFGYPGQRSKESSYAGAYTENKSGLTRTEDFQFGAESRDIFDDVTANQRPRGDDNWGFDAPGPIKAGVNRKQGK
jgi:hypothetical protein